MIENKIEYEKIKLLTVYKQNGQLNAKLEEEIINDFELYGFLKIYLKIMEEQFKDNMTIKKNEN